MIGRRVRHGAAIGVAIALIAAMPALADSTTSRQQRDIGVLASDALGGRDNGTFGSVFAQQYIINELKPFAVGLDSSRSGDDAFRQPFPGGTNILGLIRGRELPNEYVVVGAHYDHLGSACRTSDPSDHICNGATDNAAGDANVLAIARALGERRAPRRSVIFALWDREEDGLLGSAYYVQHPLVPLADTVAYVNYDIQGANLLPSLRRDTFAVGAETGGAQLQRIVAEADRRVPLDTRIVSSIFGEGRSDYVNFIGAQVPTVFFSDSTGPCYHTAQDDIHAVDFSKLALQERMTERVVRDLVRGPRLQFSGNNPLATYTDAVQIAEVSNRATADVGRFPPAQQTQLLQFRDTVNAIVQAGPQNFDANAINSLLTGAATAVSLLNSGVCDAFLAPHGR